MVSASAQVFSLPELLEHILLSLPVRDNGLPCFQYFVVQRVSRGFKKVIEGSRAIRQRMFLEDLDTRPDGFRYELAEWLSERGILPLMPKDKAEQTLYRYYFAPERFYLDEPGKCETLPSPKYGVVYTTMRAHESRSRLEKPRFGFWNASWRRFPVHPTVPVHIEWQVYLDDDLRRLYAGRKQARLIFEFHFDELLHPGTLGELVDKVEEIKTRKATEHIENQRETARSALQQHSDRVQQLMRDQEVIRAQNARGSQCLICSGAKHNVHETSSVVMSRVYLGTNSQ